MNDIKWDIEGYFHLTMKEPIRVLAIRRNWLGKSEVKLAIPGVPEMENGAWFREGDAITLSFPGQVRGHGR